MKAQAKPAANDPPKDPNERSENEAANYRPSKEKDHHGFGD